MEAVLFDLGGTLVDERDYTGWTELARHVFVDVTPEELRDAFEEVEREHDVAPIGPVGEATLREFWRRVLERAADHPVDPAAAGRFLDARRQSPDPPLALYSDVRRCLDRLRTGHRRLGVVSNSQSEASVRRVLDRVGVIGYFERVVSSGTEGVSKPDPAIFRRALERLGLEPAAALYVGNLEHTDAIAAHRAGLHSVWLHREGTGISDGTPEITSLLEVPLVVREIETGESPWSARPASHA